MRLSIAFAMINCNRRDGSARAVNEVAERLAERHEVHLFARKAQDLDLQKVRWHRVPGPSWPEVVDFWTYYHSAHRLPKGPTHFCRSTLKATPTASGYDIVHSIGCNAPQANVITIQNIQPAKQKMLVRLGRSERVSPARRFTRMLYLRVTSRAERQLYTQRPGRRPPLFLPVSKGVEAELRAHFDIGDAPVRIVPNAADTAVFHPIADLERRTWREANGLDQSAVLLIFSGGEWARKGLEDALRGLALVDRPNWQFFVAGDDPDRARFHRMVQDLGLRGRVIFGGFRHDVATAMASADLFLFPSLYEAFSLATIEAAACGLPVVATRINGTEDFIEPGVTGEFIDWDAEQMAMVLRRLVDDGATRREMGANARRLVEDRYTWDRVTAMTELAYYEYLNGHPAC